MERGRIVFCIFLAACGVWLLQSCGEKGMEKEPNAACDRVRLAEYECKEDCGNPLCGRWRWVETNAPLPEPYNHETPESTGRCQVLCLSHDSTWRWFLDGQLVDTGRYTTVRKVAKKGWEKEDELYNEILFLSHKAPPEDGSKYSRDWIGGSSYAYSIRGSNLHMGDPPGAVGGSACTWEKR